MTLTTEASAPNVGFNPAVSAMDAPPIPTVQAWAASYGGQLGPLIDLSQAVPGYAPHRSLLDDVARLAIEPALGGYGEIEGEAALRQAHAAHSGNQLGAALSADNVQITSGCNQAFVVAMLTFAKPGDRVLLTNPCFFNHDAALRMLGLEPCFVDCAADDGFAPDPDAIGRAVAAHGVRVVALISPNNPTGAVYDCDRLAAIQAVCRAAGAWLVVDETYADFISGSCAGGRDRHRLLDAHDWEKNTVLLYSFSKAYCTPGFRVGAMIAGADVVKQTMKVVDNLQICAPRHAQAALAAAVPRLASWRADNLAEIGRRADAFRASIAQAPGWTIDALGAYFAYVRHPFAGASSMDVAGRMARDGGVLCLPGAFFGARQDAYLRIAFANADVSAIGHLAPRLSKLVEGG